MPENMWMVRAGRAGRLFDDFIEKNHVSIGLGEAIGKIRSNVTRADVVELYRGVYPSWSDGKVVNAAGQLYRFHAEIKKGDTVATYDPSIRRYVLGKVTGDAEWIEDGGQGCAFPRAVTWTLHVPRDALSVTTTNTLGAIQTLFLLNEDAAAELRQLAVPLAAPDDAEPAPASKAPAKDATSIDDIREESIEKAGELIEDHITKLDPYELQDLVAGILRAMGYKTRVSGPGADRGVDIFASPDGLGLQEPRILSHVG